MLNIFKIGAAIFEEKEEPHPWNTTHYSRENLTFKMVETCPKCHNDVEITYSCPNCKQKKQKI